MLCIVLLHFFGQGSELTPLTHACFIGVTDSVKILLNAGANPNGIAGVSSIYLNSGELIIIVYSGVIIRQQALHSVLLLVLDMNRLWDYCWREVLESTTKTRYFVFHLYT